MDPWRRSLHFFLPWAQKLERLISSIRKDLYYRQLRDMVAQQTDNTHAINVMKEPAVAPAAPKHANVETVGYVPGVLICSRGSKLKFLLNQLAYVYLDLWYTEKEIVRTSVTLANGAATPRKKPRIFSVLYVCWTQSTKLRYLYVCMRVLTESSGN